MLAKCSTPLRRHRPHIWRDSEYTQVGNSDLNITPGCGAWAIGGTGYDFAWGKQDDADSIATIHRSLELGVNWVDMARDIRKK